MLGFSYVSIFSSVLVKAVYIWRQIVDDNGKFGTGDRLTTPSGLLLTAGGFIFVQAVLMTGWLMLKPTGMEIEILM